MRKLWLLILFCLFLAAGSVDARMVSYLVGGAAAPTPVARWRFESGATFDEDSVGNNDLTNSGVSENTTDYIEGSCSADYESAEADEMEIADTDLDSGFPGKNGETNRDFTITFWYRPESLPAYVDSWVGKGTIYGSQDDASYEIKKDASDYPSMQIGYNGGDTWEEVTHGTVLPATSEWYFIAAVHDYSNSLGNGARYYKIHVFRESTCSTLGTDLTGNFTNTMNIEDSDLNIGNSELGGNEIDGELDDIRVYDQALTQGQIDTIRAENSGC